MELDNTLLNSVFIRPVVHQIPSALCDLTCVIWVGILSQLLDQLNLEDLNLIDRVTLWKPRQRLTNMVAPDVGRDNKTVT